ncbi:hypothetical protein [Christiangramia aestuarii]
MYPVPVVGIVIHELQEEPGLSVFQVVMKEVVSTITTVTVAVSEWELPS